MTRRSYVRLFLYACFFIVFFSPLLSSCFRSSPRPDIGDPEVISIFGDADIDAARLELAEEQDVEGTEESTPLPEPTVDKIKSSTITAQAVLPNAGGSVVYLWNDPAATTNPWRVLLHNQRTDLTTTVYAGTREISSVATSGDGNTLLISMKETTAASSDFEVYQLVISPKSTTRITNNGFQDTNVSMSADSSFFVWEGERASSVGVRQVFIRDNKITPVKTTVLSNAQTQPSMSGNGEFITMLRRNSTTNNYVLILYNRLANNYTTLRNTARVVSSPSPSNDGKKVAWLEVVNANNVVYLRNLTANTTTSVYSTTAPLDHPHLSSDGNFLTYAQKGSTFFSVFTREIGTGQQAATSDTSTANAIQPYWQFLPPPPPPPPFDADDIQINGGAAPMVFGAGSFTFDASIFGGSNYQWNFGDGSSDTGEFVEKDYANPGKYTVTLSFTDANGQQQSFNTEVANYDEIHNLPSTRAATGDNRVVFDVEFPLDGFIYEWDTGDGQVVQQPRVEKDYSNSVAPGSTSALGFYDVVLNVYDNRENVQAAASGIQTAAVEPVLASTQYTRVNLYHAKPVAKFTTQTMPGIAIAGYAPFTVNFDASSSTSSDASNPLTYEWSFGDGTNSTDAITSKTYETQGRYLVTLRVKDKYQQEDISQTFVYVLTNRVKVIGRVSYPQLTASLQAEEQEEAALLAEARQMTLDDGALAEAELQAQDVAAFDVFYPMVLHNTAVINSAIFYPLTGSFVFQGLLLYVNGLQLFDGPNVFVNKIYDPKTGQFTGLVSSVFFQPSGLPRPVRDGINTVQVINISQLFDLKYSGFTGLRVPRVSISILPDEQLPGNMPSPMLVENTVVINGQTQLLLQVNIRESEAAEFAEFEVPVYAVNAQGNHLTNLDGLFRARFDSILDSEVVDGIMVQGKAAIKVKLPLNVYGNGQPIDLTRVRIYSNTPSCDGATLYSLPNPDAGGTPSSTAQSNRGCTFVTASYNAPTNTAVPAYAYTLPPDFDIQTNKIKLGANTTEAYDNNLKDVTGNVATFVIGFIPILGDSVDLLTQVYNTAAGNEIDPVLATLASAGLVLDIFTGGVGDLTSIFKGAYRLSLQAAEQGLGGVLALVIREQAQSLLAGAITSRQFIETLGDRFKTFVDFAKPGAGCGFLGYNCWGIYDRLALGFKNGGLASVDAIKKLDDEVNSDAYAWLEKSTALNDILSCPLNLGAINYLQGNSVITSQAARKTTNICPSKTTGRTKVNTGATYPKSGKPIYFQRPDVTETTITKNASGAFDKGSELDVRSELFNAVSKPGDQRCHIIGSQFGGGASVFNFFPCKGSLNGGDLRVFETKLKDYIVLQNTIPSFKLKVTFEYTDTAYPNRPSKMIYEFFDNNNNPIQLPDVGTRKEFINP